MGVAAASILGQGAGAVVQRQSVPLRGRSPAARTGSFAHSDTHRSQACTATGGAAEMPRQSFHQDRMSAANNASAADLPPLQLLLRMAERDDELQAVAWLRARSFYAYPPERRRFAGEIHQAMVADEEFKALKAQRVQRKLDEGGAAAPAERSACLVALHAVGRLEDDAAAEERLLVSDDGEAWLAVVGTLDLHAVRALPGEVLIGSRSNAAYLANVCTSSAARRRGVGTALLNRARALARRWGVEGLYVHTMVVNEVALGFYERNGFEVEREESSNQAHHRGRCLDGVEGRGRTALLRDTRLHV